MARPTKKIEIPYHPIKSISELLEEGKTHAEIGDYFGVSQDSISRRIRENMKGSKKHNIVKICIDSLCDIAIGAIDNMSPVDISMSNIYLYFSKFPRVRKVAEKSIRRIRGDDPRDLSIAFGNNFVRPDTKRMFETNTPISECSVLLGDEDAVIYGIEWLTKMAMEHSCFWVKWNINIHPSALSSVESMQRFIDLFDEEDTKTEEWLIANGRK